MKGSSTSIDCEVKKRPYVNIDETHIIPYLQGELNEEQQVAFEHYVRQHPDFRKEVEDIRFIWQATETLKRQQEIDISRGWKKLSWSLWLNKSMERSWKAAKILIAASVIPLLCTTYSLSNRLTDIQHVVQDEIEVTTAYGLISKIILPDSSEVSLNSGSTLRYPQQFVSDTRQVRLIGEAYFKVKADPENRFDVLLPDGVCVSAYGTEFNINAYEDQLWIETVLADGNVEVTRDWKDSSFSKVLSPGQMAFTRRGEEDILVSNVNLYAKTAWKDGKMVFRRAKMPEISRRLSQHFNVDIELHGKELHQYEYSATFTTETLTDILNLLKQSAPLEWRYIEPQRRDDFSYTKRKVIIRLL
ncbi:MAG: DUF4974 domain-containing protein [Tannerellaceae bacterium]|nr:DUF4974 domain-containing protein [Tannerellaceae bacterium]